MTVASTATDATSAPLDHARLADVLRGSALAAPAFLAEFRRSVDVDVGQLLAAADSGDLARVEQVAHRIEGASQVIGAGPLGRTCAAVTRACRSDVGALRPALETLLASRRALDVCLDALHAAGPAASTPTGAGDHVCSGLVFLVADDHDFQRSTIMRLLRQLGALEVHGFADGASALAAAREIKIPAILVLDLAMPSLNGMDVMRSLGEERLPVAVIMNSALAEDMLAWPLQTARSYGTTVLGAVSKPLTAAKLAPLLAQHRHDQGALARSPVSPLAAP